MFDVAVVGAGINGCASAHFLSRAGFRVALIDVSGIASGGSGAAGAFISPKISKSGPLKVIMDDAYAFSLSFYDTVYPDLIRNASQLHIAKNEFETPKVVHFKQHTKMALHEVPDSLRALLSREAAAAESVYFHYSGVVDAPKMCEALASGATYFDAAVSRLERVEGGWRAGPVTAATVLLATGAYDAVVPEPYIGLRGVWGHRIDIRTSTPIGGIIHHKVSLAPTDASGISAIGATHDVHYHPQRSAEPYDFEAGRRELIEKATETVALENVEILRDYTGLRSGSNDYLPILGPLVDTAATLEQFPELAHGAAVDPEAYRYHEGVYMINGSGGYGFVLAPYLASQFAEHLRRALPLDPAMLPSRFFTRWVKRAFEEMPE